MRIRGRMGAPLPRPVAAGLLLALAACGQTPANELALRQGTTSYLFTIKATQAPPHAEDSIRYDVVVLDRKTRQPIQNGEGQIYAGHPQGPRTWDGFAYGPEVGTYHGWMRFIIPGVWNVHVRFRRDSLSPLEDSEWMQDVIESKPYQKPGRTP